MTATPERDDRAWLADQVTRYSDVLPRFQAYAKVLDAALRGAASRVAPFAIVQSRAKAVPSFAEKALRKRATRPDPVAMFTDLCGARMIARTRAEVDALSGFVKANFDVDIENSDDASDRLQTTEFGYRSIHFIVSLRRDIDYGMTIPEELYGLKAEIQLRTTTEHAYSDFAHDLTYKGAFPLPATWRRELAGAAAALEEVDAIFSRVETGLHEYVSNYGTFVTEEQTREEIARLTIVLEHVPRDEALAGRIASLALGIGDWDTIVAALSPLVGPEPEATSMPILRDLGIALTKRGRRDREGEEYLRGQAWLELASRSDDVDAICALAGTWKGIDEDRALDLYRRAFELDPTNPYPIGNYLDLELVRNPGALASVRPLLRGAAERCQHHIDVGINLPWAFYDLGRFRLLLGEPYEALAAYAQALATSKAPFMIETTLDSIERLAESPGAPIGVEGVRTLLLLGLATRFDHAGALERVRAMATTSVAAIREPIMMVAGGTDPRLEEELRAYTPLLTLALADFEGTVISGGTKQGICGIVGDVAEASGGRITAVGYLPAIVPEDADPHPGYELRRTRGAGFSSLEPLQGWVDLIAAGVSPTSVRVLGINGGTISAAEYRIALGLGALVGLVAESGREASRLLADLGRISGRLIRLPRDAETLRAFVAPTSPPLDERDELGHEIHERTRKERAKSADADPRLVPWGALPENLRDSNRAQADHIVTKLNRIGCSVVPQGTPGTAAVFTPAEVECLSEVEHGRWTAERLMDGWVLSEVRDPAHRRSPYLVGWEALPDDVKEYDREAVRRIPDLLASIGLEARRETPKSATKDDA